MSEFGKHLPRPDDEYRPLEGHAIRSEKSKLAYRLNILTLGRLSGGEGRRIPHDPFYDLAPTAQYVAQELAEANVAGELEGVRYDLKFGYGELGFAVQSHTRKAQYTTELDRLSGVKISGGYFNGDNLEGQYSQEDARPYAWGRLVVTAFDLLVMINESKITPEVAEI